MSNRYNKFRAIGYPLIGIMLSMVFNLMNPHGTLFNESVMDRTFDFLLAIAYTALIMEVGILVTFLLDRYYPWQQSLKIRFLIQLLLQVAGIVSIVSLLYLTLPPASLVDYILFRQAIVIGIIFSLLVTAIFTAEFFFSRWTSVALEAAEHKQKATEAHLEALRTQIDPHFLFNNFSTLVSLIKDESDLAIQYVNQLSSVYRHILNNKNYHVVSLSTEIEFIKAYLFLYQIRYKEGLEISINIPDELLTYGIAPATLQLLIENAIKHNSISRNEPLSILIFTDDNNHLIIKNNRNKRNKKAESTGLGLKNITERYRLISNEMIDIHKTNSEFVVRIPLLTFSHD